PAPAVPPVLVARNPTPPVPRRTALTPPVPRPDHGAANRQFRIHDRGPCPRGMIVVCGATGPESGPLPPPDGPRPAEGLSSFDLALPRWTSSSPVAPSRQGSQPGSHRAVTKDPATCAASQAAQFRYRPAPVKSSRKARLAFRTSAYS